MHLFRTYVAEPHGPSIFMRRKGEDGWAYQGFNYPKSVWGGQLKAKIRKLEGEERAKRSTRRWAAPTPRSAGLAGAAQAGPHARAGTT